MDRRISKTQKALANSTTKLMAKFAWRDITISMLCEEANISRSTFYSHFTTKGELLEQMFRWAEAELTSQQSESRGLDEKSKFLFLPGLVERLRIQRKIFQRQQNSDSGIAIADRTRLMIANMIQIEAERSKFADLFDDRSVTFLSGGLSAVIRKWAEENHAEANEELVRVLDRYVSWFLALLEGKMTSLRQ